MYITLQKQTTNRDYFGFFDRPRLVTTPANSVTETYQTGKNPTGKESTNPANEGIDAFMDAGVQALNTAESILLLGVDKLRQPAKEVKSVSTNAVDAVGKPFDKINQVQQSVADSISGKGHNRLLPSNETDTTYWHGYGE